MNDWNIGEVQDNIDGLALVSRDIVNLVSSLCAEFEEAKYFLPVWELSKDNDSVGRSVVQFHVSPKLFNTFFNSNVGYRAMFRRGPWIGSSVNAAIVAGIKTIVSQKLSRSVNARVLKWGAKMDKQITLDSSQFLRSLDFCLSKVWYCTAEVVPKGKPRKLPSGVSNGEKINVGLQYPWKKIEQGSDDCIIEIKGAFLGERGLFQIKDPELRARRLSESGEA